uniref:NADH dehydrogenase subunit 2 n=1 Tax=Sinergasilus major TaxID=232573 RepID=UPI00286ACFE6|nr:NADH dehydrogenase subunit 2 [Sinergasilus major]WKB17750.1 NADH dehydrogenase subunit 2 [Sinergasilus major]
MQLILKSNLLITLLLLVVVGVSMSNFLLIWVFMEISTLVFIFIISMDQHSSGTLSLKYFVTQSFISMIMVITFLLMDGGMTEFKTLFLSVLSMWKLGVPPFQNWFMNMIMDSSWFVFFLISTVMKAIPFLLLSIFFSFSALMVGLFSVLGPSLMGVSQMCLKKIMGTSSMFTSGWVMISMSSSSLNWLLVFTLYSFMMLAFCLMISPESMMTPDASYSPSVSDSFIVFFILLSLSGIPPMSGFFMKIYILMSIFMDGHIILATLIVLASSFSVYMYIKNIFKYMALSSLGSSFISMKFSFFSWGLLLNMLSAIILYI